MSHTRAVCQHGITISQCRCPALNKTVKVVRPCPFGVRHLGMLVVHPEPPTAGASEGVQLPAGSPGGAGQVSLGAPEASGGAEGVSAEDRVLYLEAITRYARDAEFHARAKRIEQLIVAAEGGTPSQDSRVGMWIGAAVALHLAEKGQA